MATLPYFVLSPSTILSLAGLVRGPDTTHPTPSEDWRQAKVDVIIPAFNEADNIVLCLASVMRQTMQPRKILLIDDGSNDGTVERASAFCAHHGVALTAIRRRKPIGKTPTLKRQSRELDSDVEFILDADTVLESPDYIARTVESLYQAVGIASAFGTILPQRLKDRHQVEGWPEVREFAGRHPDHGAIRRRTCRENIARGVTNLYREVLYLYLQRFIYRGQLAFFGTTSNPVGCAVAYRRKYVQSMFDYISPILGDDLTNSEDIFIGLDMLNEGYRNVQVTDVYARTVEPQVHRLPRQTYLWSSAFLQSCYYFDPLLRSPFKALKRWRSRRARPTPPSPAGRESRIDRMTRALPALPQMAAAGAGDAMLRGSVLGPIGFSAIHSRSMVPASGTAGTREAPRGGDRRVIREPYRQAFGRARTEAFGRPAGWMLLMSAIEKIFFPTTLLMMLILRMWEALLVTVSVETATCLFVLWLVMRGQRLQYVVKGLAIMPLRYALAAFDLVTIGRFATDLWITGNRRWRK
jgi:glycosyltransferase involved in cell wall biosynthesis